MDKLFGGVRLRHLREERALSQVDLARMLGISSSYLNQIEHDTRPLTAAVLMRISEVFGIDPAFFAPGDSAGRLAELREAVLSQSAGAQVTQADLQELVSGLPEIANAVIAMHRRMAHLVEVTETLTDAREFLLDTDPHQQARDFFNRHENYIDALDRAAEELSQRINSAPRGLRDALENYLTEVHQIRVIEIAHPGDESYLTAEMHHFNKEQRALFVSPYLTPGQQAFRMATQIAFLECDELIELILGKEQFESAEARALTRIGLANHFAAALILPYGPFYAAAERFRYDIERLSRHFDVGYETIAHRLSTLQRPNARGVPFTFVRVDRAGNISKRQSAGELHFSSTGGTCPLWNVYEAFGSPGRIVVQVASMPDGRRYLWVARTVTHSYGAHGQPGRTFSIGLGCALRHAGRLVYSAGLDLGDAAAVPIGPGCRICERTRCPQRASAPIGETLAIDEGRSTFVPYPVLRDAGHGPGYG